MFIVQLYYFHEGKSTEKLLKTQGISMIRGHSDGLIVQTLLKLRLFWMKGLRSCTGMRAGSSIVINGSGPETDSGERL